MLPQISGVFAERGVTEVRPTAHRGDETDIAKRAISEGFGTIVVVGGDGTTSNVANSILHSGRDVRLAVMPAGTGNDFAKVLGTAAADIATVARLATEPAYARVDAGKIEDVFFLNSCGFGFDVAVLEGVERTSWLRGNSVYLYTALRQILGYRGIRLALESQSAFDLHLLLVIANTPHFGGMFRIAPDASIVDGMLDAIAIADIRPLRRIAVLAAASRGNHMRYSECSTARAASFDVSFPVAPVYQTDGELHHARSAQLSVASCASALRVVVAPGFCGR
jgi:diacylglycerol kinase (ATP)